LAFFSFFEGDCEGGVAVTGAASVSAILMKNTTVKH
jgi:hypothetical protein